MPEGHTIHRLARDLNATLRGAPVEACSPQGRFREEAEQIDGSLLAEASAWGKHLVLDFEDAPLVHIHLGLIGKLRRSPADAPAVGQIRLRLVGEQDLWDLTGPMVCALIDPDDLAAITDPLGPDPLRAKGKLAQQSREEFVEGLGRKRIGLSAALLDQKVIAGIGNVFRSEFCYLAGIHPETPANELSAEQANELWDTAVAQLRQGVKLNRITTRRPEEVGTSAGKISGDDRLYVYKRDGQPCHRCGDEIRLTEIAKRKAWYCPTCQSTT